MSTTVTEVRDLDHVVMADGRIYRVVGNLDHPAKFVGYNVYSPDPAGDWLFRSTPYRKRLSRGSASAPAACRYSSRRSRACLLNVASRAEFKPSRRPCSSPLLLASIG